MLLRRHRKERKGKQTKTADLQPTAEKKAPPKKQAAKKPAAQKPENK